MVHETDMFSNRAKEAFYSAQDFARAMGNNFIGTEHLLLGVARDREGVAYKALKSLGIAFDRLKAEVENFIRSGGQPGSGIREFDYDPGAKLAIRTAMEEAQRLRHHYVGTEHLLLGLVADPDSVAVKVLDRLGATPDRVREAVYDILKVPERMRLSPEQEQMPNLARYARDLTSLAKENRLDPVVGRDQEIERVIQVLSRRTKNNPVLIGDPGVGKTAIVEGLANRIVQNQVPEVLSGSRIYALDMGGLVAGAKFRGEFEERLKGLVEEVKENGNIVLFIDELHTVVGAGAAEGAVDAANILKPSLARGELQAIGATTLDEYRKHVEKDAALERRFQPILVSESTVEETVEILKGLRDKYEAHHKVKISDQAIKAAASLSARYISDRFLPDKAIDLVDEAAAKVRLSKLLVPPDMQEIEVKIDRLETEKEAAIAEQDFEKANRVHIEQLQLKARLEKIEERWEAEKARVERELVVKEEDIAGVVSRWTGIPVTRLTEEESERLMRLEEELHRRVVDQDAAVETIAQVVRSSRAGLTDPRRPIGSFIFLGPTGVGKTELAKSLAEVLYGDEEAMVRIDMSEYMERHSVSRLVGAPPGYVGYEEGGQLTEVVRRRPYSVILLDEIEKAHPEVFNILLQVLDDGRLTDGKGRMVNFKNVIVIMTSNVGAPLIMEMSTGITEQNEAQIYQQMRDEVMGLLKQSLRPEFLNRIDEIIVFHALTMKEIRRIVELQFDEVRQRMAERDIELEITDQTRDHLARIGYDPAFGARPLKRMMQRYVSHPLANRILKGEFKEGDRIVVDYDEELGEVVFKAG